MSDDADLQAVYDHGRLIGTLMRSDLVKVTNANAQERWTDILIDGRAYRLRLARLED